MSQARAVQQKAEALAQREALQVELSRMQRRAGGEIISAPWPTPGSDPSVIPGPTVAIVDTSTGCLTSV